MSSAFAPTVCDSPSQDNSPPQELCDKLLNLTSELSMVSATAMEAMRMTESPDCSISDFATIVERDVKLTTDILSLANGALYAPTAPIISLHQAVIRLGLNQCKNLILTTSIAGLMRQVPVGTERVRQLLWRHSFTTAVAAMELNRRLGLGFQGEEFTAGLIHDIGRTLFVVAIPEVHCQIDSITTSETPELLEREQEALGTTHCEFGAWFAEYSGLPPVLVSVIRHHHDPTKAEEAPRLVALTAAAEHVANHIYWGTEEEAATLTDHPGFQALEECVPTDVIDKLSGDISGLLEQITESATQLADNF